MNSKIKKLLITTASLTTLGLSAFAASCGNTTSTNTKRVNYGPKLDISNLSSEERERVVNSTTGANPGANGSFSTVEASEIVIGTTFSGTGVQAKAIDAIIAKYNELVKKNDPQVIGSTEGVAKPIKHLNMGSGYAAGTGKLSSDLQAGITKDFYNLVINYAPAASILAEKNMLLSFNDTFSNFNTDINIIDEKFVSTNTNSQYLKRPSTYIFPLAKSSNVLSINAPVLSYIIKEMKAAGAKVNDDVKDLVDKLDKEGASDQDEVKKIWGSRDSSVNLNDYEIKASIFENYVELLDFAQKAQSLLTNAKNSGRTGDLHVFGVDDVAGLFTQALYASLNADESKMIPSISKDAKGDITINYGGYSNSVDTEGKNAAKRIYDKLQETVKTGSVRIFGGGEYSSTGQVAHKIAFSIGSSAGYTHNFVEQRKIRNAFTHADYQEIKDDLADGKYATSMLRLSKADGNDSTVAFIGLDDRKNKIHKPGTDAKEIGQYDKLFLDEQSVKDYNELTKEFTEEDFSKAIAITILVTDKDKREALIKKAKEEKIYAGLVVKTKEDETPGVFLIIKNALTIEKKDDKDVAKENLSAIEEVLKKLGYKYEKRSATNTLQENELIGRNTPLKWEAKNTYKVAYGQGPSLIGVKNNSVDDKATKLFVKWLFSNNKYKFKEKGRNDQWVETEKEYTPIEYFDEKASYITPIKGFQNSKLNFGKNKYLDIVQELFDKLSTDKDFKVYEDAGSVTADKFRTTLSISVGGLQTQPDTDFAIFTKKFSQYK